MLDKISKTTIEQNATFFLKIFYKKHLYNELSFVALLDELVIKKKLLYIMLILRYFRLFKIVLKNNF